MLCGSILQADVEDLAQARDFLHALLIEAEGRGDTDLAARAERWATALEGVRREMR